VISGDLALRHALRLNALLTEPSGQSQPGSAEPISVWEVELAAPRGRVVVDVDKRTGKATIVRHGGGTASQRTSMRGR
jgi:hypothetical protein